MGFHGENPYISIYLFNTLSEKDNRIGDSVEETLSKASNLLLMEKRCRIRMMKQGN